MKHVIRSFLILLSVALTGAPFGMGRMMDGAHGSVQASEHTQMEHAPLGRGDAPAHTPSTPHFMMCSMCFAFAVDEFEPLKQPSLAQAVLVVPSAILHGKAWLPDLPPPRT